MECPICKKEMLEGCIPTEGSALEWHGECTVRLTKTPFFGVEEAQAFYCPDCSHIFLPVQEIESFSDKMMKKLDEAVDKIQSAKEGLDKQREERRNQKESDRRKGKDPWEM